MPDFFKPLTKGTEEIISQTPVEVDKLRFTTDTGRLFLDTSNGRIEFSDVIKNLTDIEIKTLGSYQDKIYLAKDTFRTYYYNSTQNELIELANTASNVNHAQYATFTEQPDEDSSDDKAATIKWTNEKIAEAIGEVVQFNILVVEELPEIGEVNTIYFVPSEDPDTGNTYEEYMWLNDQWELLGTTKIDLSGYYNSYEVTGDGSFISGVSADGNTIKFTKSNSGTVSYAINAGTASHSTNADTATFATNAASATNAATSTYATNAGTATYATNSGTATHATNATNAGTSTYATNAGTATKATNADTATYSVNAGTAVRATNADTATYAVNAGTATKATNSDTATYAKNAGTATYGTNAGTAARAANADTATYAVNAGSASYSDHGVESIEREGDTSVFKVTRSNGTTLTFTQLDPGSATYSYTASNGIQVTDDRKIRNLGVLAVTTGGSNGTVKITTANTNGETSTSEVSVKGLGNLAYVSSTTATTANYAANAGTATKATNADTATYSVNAGTAVRATNADTATYAVNAGSASYSTSAGDGIASVSSTASSNDIIVTRTNGSTFSFQAPMLISAGLAFEYISGVRYIRNSGVTEVQTGGTNGTIEVLRNGTTSEVPVKGLGNLAYVSSTTATTANYSKNGNKANFANAYYPHEELYWDFGVIKDENLEGKPYTWNPAKYTRCEFYENMDDFPLPHEAGQDCIYYVDLSMYYNNNDYTGYFDAYICDQERLEYKYFGRYYLGYYDV